MTVILAFSSCKKQIATGADTNDVFWVTNNGADMPVWIKGNTASKVIILVVHGGPGDGAYDYSDYETARLREKYAVAYWDQRNAGSSAGNNNISQLNLPQMVNDLEDVVKVLKYRYAASKVFLYCHSFGGLLGAAYLVKDSNQAQIKGWIEIDGAHNYPLCNSLSKKMLIDTGTVQINEGKNVSQWHQILDYCESHDPATSFIASSQIELYAHDAEKYMGITPPNENITLFSPEDPSALLSNLYKLYYTPQGDTFIESLQTANYSDQLSIVKIPSLLLWGQYDFTVPPALGYDAANHLGSAYKKLVFFPHSGHRPMQDDTDAVEDEIIGFIEQFK
jgi:pimeloyl-ACP methyl ester carboxylesterase